MHVEDLSIALMIRALEESDETGEIISFEERRRADERLEGDRAGHPSEALLSRMRQLAPLVERRAPLLWRVATQSHYISGVITWIILGGSALAGLSVQSLGGSLSAGDLSAGGARFHVLSPPLLGLIAWNIISLTLLALITRRDTHKLASPKPSLTLKSSGDSETEARERGLALHLARWITRAQALGAQRALAHHPHASIQMSALHHYLTRASASLGQLSFNEAKRVLHLSGFTFALGVLASAYWGGVVEAYHATAESTFLGTGAIEALLNLALAPSILIMGSLPSLEPLASESGAQSLGLAAPWVHHYAISVGVWVIAPRLTLAWRALITRAKLSASLTAELSWLERVPTLNVALAAHTNIGKTSLARTLLRRDVGEVRDEEHVTRHRASYFLINDPQARIRLWDTPGFGERAPLHELLKECEAYQARRPDVDALRELVHRRWDKRVSRDALSALDLEALSALSDEADMIIYLVPAHPSAEQRAQARVEGALLALLKVPVIVVINRVRELDPERDPEREPEREPKLKLDQLTARSVTLWRSLTQEIAQEMSLDASLFRVHVLDAFQKTYSEERSLYELIRELAPPEKREIASHALEVWRSAQRDVQERLALSVTSALRSLSALRVTVKSSKQPELSRAEDELRREVERILHNTHDRCLDLLGLVGDVRSQTLTFALGLSVRDDQRSAHRARGALWGGIISGLLSGLAADVMAGGLTLGGGLIIGGVLGALGGAGLAEGIGHFNQRERTVQVSADALKLLLNQLLTFIMCASAYGRARGVFSGESDDELAARCADVIKRLSVRYASLLDHDLSMLCDARGAAVNLELDSRLGSGPDSGSSSRPDSRLDQEPEGELRDLSLHLSEIIAYGLENL